jgi:hypothetical protein
MTGAVATQEPPFVTSTWFPGPVNVPSICSVSDPLAGLIAAVMLRVWPAESGTGARATLKVPSRIVDVFALELCVTE